MSGNLIIGGSGFIGSYLLRSLEQEGQKVSATYNNYKSSTLVKLDIRNKSEVELLFQNNKPATVYLPAAFPNVDYCEAHASETREINVLGVKNVVQSANNIHANLIYFSSDYVFDGLYGPYDETDIANPISEYGRQKLSAEHYISLFSKRFIIIRTTVVYGWEQGGKNFIYRLLRTLKEGKSIKVPVDQIGTPTYVKDLAQNVVKLVKSDYYGVINIAGPARMNRYEFALMAAKTFKLPQDMIEPVETRELNQIAARPLSAGLRSTKAKAILHTIFSSPADGLKDMYKVDNDVRTA